MASPVNAQGSVAMCYDAANLRFSKAFSSTSNASDEFTFSIIFINATQYNMCVGPNDCFGGVAPSTCTKAEHASYPYPSNQFENYTLVGEEVVDGNRHVMHWVGLSQVGAYDTDQYFYTSSGKYPGFPAGNVMIAEPDWTTEIRWFDTFESGANDDCFKLIAQCNQ
eukprot:CAMPEP_0197058232 /NCGR_PEP_ID=MMETSP1384-20130603/105421_1 /TAXON_ID=29189 /ORGANISM="Ammonia sp." /LENGTH=165 /DNA_ID=CAMNT_0042492909 /DNA_START=104 /DNA_END=601 /DNA_ORIENTATION=-